MPVRQLFCRTHKSDGKNHQRIEDKRRQIIDDDARRGRPETTASVFFEIRFVYRHRFCPAEACEHETSPSGSKCFAGFNVILPAHFAVGSPHLYATNACANSCRVSTNVTARNFASISTNQSIFSPPAFCFTIYAL